MTFDVMSERLCGSLSDKRTKRAGRNLRQNKLQHERLKPSGKCVCSFLLTPSDMDFFQYLGCSLGAGSPLVHGSLFSMWPGGNYTGVALYITVLK